MDIKREGSTIYTNLRLLASNYFKEFKMQNVLIRHGYSKAQATSRCQNQKRDIKAYIIIFKYFSGIYELGLIPRTLDELNKISGEDVSINDVKKDYDKLLTSYKEVKTYINQYQ